MAAADATFISVLIIGGLFLSIAWIALPFAMFGIKPILRDLLKETRETNHLLRTQQMDAQKKGS